MFKRASVLLSILAFSAGCGANKPPLQTPHSIPDLPVEKWVYRMGTVNARNADEQEMVRKGFLLANVVLLSDCFKNKWRDAKGVTYTRGRSQDEIYRSLVQNQMTLQVDLFDGSRRQNHVWNTVGYEDPAHPDVVHMNRHFVRSVSMVADNLLHEAAHSRGYVHRWPGKYQSVPYTINDIYADCLRTVSDTKVEQGVIAEDQDAKEDPIVEKAVAATNLRPSSHFTLVLPDVTWYALAISEPPVQEVECQFHKDHDHRAVKWKAGDLDRIKYVQLADKAEDWNVVCSGKDYEVSRGTDIRTFNFVGPEAKRVAPRMQLAGGYKPSRDGIAPLAGLNLDTLDRTFTIEAVSGPPSEALARDRMSLAGVVPGGNAGEQIPPAVAELFRVLAEVAVSRAQSQAGALLRSQIENAVCSQLTWNKEWSSALALQDPHCGGKDQKTCEPLLPRTCAALKATRIQEIVASAKSIYHDLLGDLVGLSSKVLHTRVIAQFPDIPAEKQQMLRNLLTPAISRVLRMALDHARGASTFSHVDAQLLLHELRAIPWDKYTPEKPKDTTWVCGFDLTFTILDACRNKGSCDSSTVQTLVQSVLANQSSNITPSPACVNYLDAVRVNWPDMSRLVLRAHEILQQERVKEHDEVRKAIELTFDLLEHGYCSSDDYNIKGECGYLRATRDMLTGAVDQNFVQTVRAGVVLADHVLHSAPVSKEVEKQFASLQKVSAVLGAVMAYAVTHADASPEEKKQQHESRKKAIESLIEASTDRTHRGGDWVASVGIMPGFTLGRQQVLTSGNPNAKFRPAISAPLGFALQYLPEVPNNSSHWGIHTQLSFIDVGQFIAINPNGKLDTPRPDTLFMIGGQVGALFGTSTNAVMFGADFRYSPTLYANSVKDSSGAWQLGFVAGYYVPFFDFN